MGEKMSLVLDMLRCYLEMPARQLANTSLCSWGAYLEVIGMEVDAIRVWMEKRSLHLAQEI